ncbi:DUF6344 domain-containing protein [Streptomyces sp. NPDC015171]|jgi:hypothetical protein|uniref:DUF6344 domain-containing protein n=1 Tax=Streptomyces sp. NPDC015171 TaxID=3364945 RepID=UPI0036F6DAD9
MTKNKVMKLWTAIVTAFLALCTALGFASAATAAPAGPRTESRTGTALRTIPTVPAAHHWVWSQARALPPTMKQRIRAEAHGKSPSCRHRPLNENEPQVPAQTRGQSEPQAPGQHPTDSLDC